MPTYELELSNGDVLEFDSPTELTSQQDILKAVIPSLVAAGTPESKRALVALQKQFSPTPLQSLGGVMKSGLEATRETVGPPLRAARDVATQAVSETVLPMVTGAKGFRNLPPGANASEEERQLALQGGKAIADPIAKAVVPQTVSDALITGALGSTARIPGIGGAALRTFLTPALDVTGKALSGEKQNLVDTAIKTGLVGGTEALGGMVKGLSGKAVREAAQENWAREDTRNLGSVIAQHTSFKNLDTPEALAEALSTTNLRDSSLYKTAQQAIQANEDNLLQGVKGASSSSSPQSIMGATTLLEKAADVSPTVTMGFPTTTTHLQPNQLLEIAIIRARKAREAASNAEFSGVTDTTGMTAHDLWEKYHEITRNIDQGLHLLSPDLQKAYRQMNHQFGVDLRTAKFLYGGKDKFLSSGLNSAKLETPEFGDYVRRHVGDIQEPGLVLGIVNLVTKGGQFGAANQRWTIAPRIGSPNTPGGRITETLSIAGQSQAGPRTTTQNAPPMGFYDIGALKSPFLVTEEDER